MFIILFLLVKLCGIVMCRVQSIEVDPATIAKPSQFDINDVPYMVSIQNTIEGENDEKVCSGFFTGPNWILTSAHCFDGGKIMKSLIKFGVNDYTYNTTNYVLARKVIIHPRYNKKSLVNDLALVRVHLTDSQMSKVKFLLSDEYGFKWEKKSPGRNCMAIGFGQINNNDTKLLMKELIVKYSPIACGCFATNRELMCGTFKSPGSGKCYDDNGGPLLCDGLVIGVANKLLQCDENKNDNCGEDTFLRYTNLCAHFPWISEFVDSFPEKCFGYGQGLMSSFTYRALPATHIILVSVLIISIH